MPKTNYVLFPSADKIVEESRDSDVQYLEKVEPASYKISFIGLEGKLCLTKIKQLESLISFNSGIFKDIIKEIDNFFSSNVKGKYEDIKVMHKLGLLLYGPPGTGKTSVARLVMESVVKKYNAICFDITGIRLSHAINAFERVRKTNPDSPFIIFCDEFERSVDNEEEEYLTFLDGIDSIPNSVFIGCTNYMNRISKRIIDRKSRIKKQFEVNSIPLEVYKEYLQDKADIFPKELVDEFSYKAVENNLTIDQFKNAIIDFHAFGVDIETAMQDSKKVYVDKHY